MPDETVETTIVPPESEVDELVLTQVAHRVLNDDTAPTVWPECDCGIAYIYRRGFTMTGMKWVWTADCKHPRREEHRVVLMTANGPYIAPGATEPTMSPAP